MFIKTETMENLDRIRVVDSCTHSIFGKHKKRYAQAKANSLVPPRGNVYCMLNRKVNTKGKIIK